MIICTHFWGKLKIIKFTVVEFIVVEFIVVEFTVVEFTVVEFIVVEFIVVEFTVVEFIVVEFIVVEYLDPSNIQILQIFRSFKYYCLNNSQDYKIRILWTYQKGWCDKKSTSTTRKIN
jgi:hypothetical protein